jgi:hypothetical protein
MISFVLRITSIFFSTVSDSESSLICSWYLTSELCREGYPDGDFKVKNISLARVLSRGLHYSW